VVSLTALGRAGAVTLDRGTIDNIAACLADGSPDVRAAAAKTLRSRPALPESIRATLGQLAMEDRFDYVRRAASGSRRKRVRE
jgi:hypothetical protein